MSKPVTVEQRRKLLDYAALEIGRLVLNGDYVLQERLDPPTSVADFVPDLGAENIDGLVAAAVRIAQHRTELLRQLRTAIQSNDNDRTLLLASVITGLREEDRQ